MTKIDLSEGMGGKERPAGRKQAAKRTAAGAKKSGAATPDSSESSTEKGDSGAESVESKIGDKKAKHETKGKAVDKTEFVSDAVADTVAQSKDDVNDKIADQTKDTKPKNTVGGDAKTEVELGNPAAGENRIETEQKTTVEGGSQSESTGGPKVAQSPSVEASQEIIKFDWIPETVMKRLLILAAWQRPPQGIHTISSVPASGVSWATQKDSVLCYKGKPATFAFVGRIMSTFFRVGEDRQPARCANVIFKFMRDVDDLACRALLYDTARPPTEGRTRKSFWAGSKRSIWNKGSRYSELQDFTEVYDGSEKMKNDYKKMNGLDNSELRPNDIVLLHCQIRRFTPNSNYVRSTWETRLRLIRVVRLFEAPLQSEKDPQSEDEGVKSAEPDAVASDDDLEF
ncbi:hypothetical protein EIP86_000258 [Pleurotus ostreatoroseus]|nr:hypothetical protein EIP86_000258 [Pleurotus ostreatoroseus]